MDWHVHSELPMVLASIGTVISLLLMTALPPSLSQSLPTGNHSLCRLPYECGEQQLYYPFWGRDRPSQCGGNDRLQLFCMEENYTYIEMGLKRVGVVNDDDHDNSVKLVPLAVADGGPDVYSWDYGYSLDFPLLMYNQTVHNITIFYDCTYSRDYQSLGCGGSGGDVVYYNGTEKEVLASHQELKDCHHRIQVAAEAVELNGVGVHDAFPLYFGKGVSVSYTYSQDCMRCVESKGSCGSNDAHAFTCYCPDGSIALPCSHPVPAPDPPPGPRPDYRSQEKRNHLRWIVIGTVAAVVVGVLALAMAMAIYFYQRRKKTTYGMSSDPSSFKDTEKRSQYFGAQLQCSLAVAWHYASSGVTVAVITVFRLLATCLAPKSLKIKSNQQIETFLKNHGVLSLKRYKFSDVKKMTNSFKDKLGQGGFGAVYKGKLSNGFDVAVKILNPSKGNGEEFINEVASISRTSHVNVVTLLGFCFEGHKKVLIYEFMSNGSLDNFIYKKDPKNTPLLSWDNLYQISIGIARGLEYLHRGCNIRILHFDIKPHNILLDENFCPKISDFGLAKLCSRKESHISMSETRGTIGYIAPEVSNRHFGRVSYKSDVYSYGMMLLEMVGMKEKNITAEPSQSSEMYFPDWIYKRLEQGSQLGPDDDGEVIIEENDVVKKMTVVGLWCIQPIPDDRPTMSKVVEMLEGSMNFLELPPRPVLSSQIRLVIESSTIVSSLVESSSIVS
ncbi:LEAF RUST 10 DISEASE-RESISTANCE LOCUS RECEPTOR-LIKE PROTEIN KINASE-like 2.5 isoform X2 [Arachis stenosperma]|uniref:LEAF RUST 10 DISEASE-RESISTANCE LOCUS RECEPTOR-LIKE PROTEIN KINASE-like 2.5 isoform X2 n=1 Tax=Arachis stenosperma TaxID=217475 RepID=UPI0025AC5856|nr:LEAF RUST 10 DISEASE-RESISTANCE LOCUS RECEPTOR-LIKE PROTEIN KINASE-like 2.5 isoform X2 [Arachis stenosperma]